MMPVKLLLVSLLLFQGVFVLVRCQTTETSDGEDVTPLEEGVEELDEETDPDYGSDNESDTEVSRASNNTMDRRTPPQSLQNQRANARNYRLMMIRRQILSTLGWRTPPKIQPSALVLREMMRRQAQKENEDTPNFTEDRLCYSASCHLPGGIDPDLWENHSPESLRLYMDVPQQRRSNSQLVSAQLKLFLLYRDGEQLNDLVVKVYQYRRPLSYRRRRLLNRRRLVLDVTLPYRDLSWISLDVASPVNDWLTGRRRNVGLEVTVQDTDGTQLDARSLFVTADCNAPREIGCREELPESDSGIMPNHLLYFEPDLRANYPYLEVVTQYPDPRPAPYSRYRRFLLSG